MHHTWPGESSPRLFSKSRKWARKESALMASMCAQVTPLTSCPVLENKTGGRRSGVRRTGKKEQGRAVRADPGTEGTVPLSSRDRKPRDRRPRGLAVGVRGIPYLRSASGLPVVLDRSSYRNKACGGTRTTASVDGALTHQMSTRSAQQCAALWGRHGHRPALWMGPRRPAAMLPAQDHGMAKGQSWDVPGWRSNRTPWLTPRHSLGSRGRMQSQAPAARPGVYLLCFVRSLPSP